jgi:hypothetical protein
MASIQNTKDYVSMRSPVYSQIEKYIWATFNKACICWIEENKNPILLRKFEEYSVGKAVVNNLFHGTNANNIDNITSGGFKPSLNRRSTYGNGVYFSTRAIYSKQYSIFRSSEMEYMFVCDVAVGKTAKGRANTNIPDKFDSFTDNLEQPDMYIVNKTEAAYPRYIVAFYPYL